MGFLTDIGKKIRGFWSRDKEQLALQFAKGSTAAGMPSTGYDLLQAYGYDVISDYLRLEHDLLSRFVDYEEMDDYPLIASALDVYADDATQTDMHLNKSLWVSSPDKELENLLNHLFHKTLRVDEDLWEITRTLVKYGQDYEELLVTNEGVKGFNFLPPPTVRRIEGPRGELYGFVQDFKGRFGYSPAEFQQILATRAGIKAGGPNTGSGGMEKVAALEDWEVVHMRLRGKHRKSIYGYAVMEPARWIWKRLMLLEDAALIYRLQRAPERYAFYVDVGDLPPPEALAWTNRIRQQFKKKKYINPTTGKLDLKFDPLSQDDDFYIPVRKGADGTRIEVLGSPSWQSMDDIEYFRDHLFSALKIPKAYLAQDDNLNKGTLSSADARFARTILRVQREIKNGMSKVARVHLAAIGIDPASVDYEMHMTTPSALFELAQLEVRNARADLAQRMQEHVSLHWILHEIYGLNDDEVATIMQQQEEDTVRRAVADARGQAAAQAEMPQPQPGQGPEGGEGGEEGGGGDQQQGGEEGGEAQQRGANLYSNRYRPGSILSRYGSGRPMTERELFAGSREGEKRAQEKLDTLLKNDKMLGAKLAELGDLLDEVRRLGRQSATTRRK